MDLKFTYDTKTKIISTPDVDFIPDPRGLGFLIFEGMKENGDSVAQINTSNGKKETFNELLNRMIRVAMELKRRGISSDDVISICTHNTMETVVPMGAAILIGAKVAPLDPVMQQNDIQHLISIVKPKCIFIADNIKEKIIESLNNLKLRTEVIVFEGYKYNDFINYKEDEDNFKPAISKDINDTTLILFSSGTTGFPKGICLSDKMLQYHLRGFKAFKAISLIFTTLYWSSATTLALGTMLYGGTRLIADHFDPKLVWTNIEKFNISVLLLTPTGAMDFFRNKPENHVTSLNVLFITGSSIDAKHIKLLQEAMPKTLVLYVYGQTELMGIFKKFSPMIKDDLDSVGLPLDGLTYKIVDLETGKNLGPNEQGELYCKTNYCMNGYYKHESKDAWDEDGFLKTGDVFYFDEDFRFYIVDRIKEMFKYKGYHIVPAKLEAIIMSHPEVSTSAVVGIPYGVDGHVPMAAVVLLPESRLNPVDIENFVNKQVDDYNQLRGGVRILNSLPMTPSNKIRRRQLRDMLMNKI